MPSGPRILLQDACYHIITRGNHKQDVFLDKQDCKAYLLKLKKYKMKYDFLLYGFCLMSNHVHLIGKPGLIENLAKFMQGLNRSYTAYFNKKYNKVGHLWQNRFKSKAIAKDSYLIDCIHYIESNPIRANIVKTAFDYEWSSHKERLLPASINSVKLLDQLYT